MSGPPPSYDASQNPYVLPESKQPARNPDYPPPPASNYGVPPFPSGSVPVRTVVVSSVAFNENPSSMTCPHCQQQIITDTNPVSGLLAWLLCGGLTLLGCWLCCCIPFCVDACKDVEHYCPNCRKLLGTYRRI